LVGDYQRVKADEMDAALGCLRTNSLRKLSLVDYPHTSPSESLKSF